MFNFAGLFRDIHKLRGFRQIAQEVQIGVKVFAPRSMTQSTLGSALSQYQTSRLLQDTKVSGTNFVRFFLIYSVQILAPLKLSSILVHDTAQSSRKVLLVKSTVLIDRNRIVRLRPHHFRTAHLHIKPSTMTSTLKTVVATGTTSGLVRPLNSDLSNSNP